MLRAKNRKSFKQSPSTFNKSIPFNVYKNTNSRLDKHESGECLLGCTNSGCKQCKIKTTFGRIGAPYRAPIAGYRKTLVCCLGIKHLVPNQPTNTIYGDNYASNKFQKDAYKQFQPQIQNKNGYINSGYNYSTKQLLSRRNRTYEIKQFNFLSKNTPCNEHSYKIIDSLSRTLVDCNELNGDKFKRWVNLNQNDVSAIYKPNNTQYSQQGAVSGGSRINRLKYQTTLKSQAINVKTINNLVNGDYPASLYQNGGPIKKSINNREHINECKRTQSGLKQLCEISHNCDNKSKYC